MRVVAIRCLQHYTFVPVHALPTGMENPLQWKEEEENTVYNIERGNGTAVRGRRGTKPGQRKRKYKPSEPGMDGAELRFRGERFPGSAAGAASEGLRWQPVSPRNECNTLLIMDAHQNTDVTHTWWECIQFSLGWCIVWQRAVKLLIALDKW